MDFVFYDLETTGISPEYDQPLQFAAILTDEHFVEKQRVNIRCRLAPHILPSPQAMIVTGVTPDQLTDPSLLSLFEFTQKIVALTEQWAPGIWVGYNTMKFDEEVLRQAFYQNLSPSVYATQFNGNTRFDILPAVYTTRVKDPEILNWPEDDGGRVSFKLDRLAPANGFDGHNAHDALGDVEATIHIARRIADRNPALWADLLSNAHKAEVQAKLETFEPIELVLRFGAGDPRAYTGVFCGYAQGANTRAAFFDLNAADPSEFLNASDEALFTAVDASPKVIRGVSTNKAPALLRMAEPSPEHQRRAALIAAAPEFRRRVGDAMAARFVDDPDAPPKTVEEQIYGEFYSNSDKNLLGEFQHADWPRRQEILASLSDRRLRQLGNRLVAFHSPELLTAEETARFRDYLRSKWLPAAEEKTQWMTIGRATDELTNIQEKNGADDAIIDAIREFFADRRRGLD